VKINNTIFSLRKFRCVVENYFGNYFENYFGIAQNTFENYFVNSFTIYFSKVFLK